MKTQISHLRSGAKNQILNPNVDYSQLPKATSHTGHTGTNIFEVIPVWQKVVSQNPTSIDIEIYGQKLQLKAVKSISQKSITYYALLEEDFLSEYFQDIKGRPVHLYIQGANLITVNTAQSWVYICPSLITIL